MTKCQNLVLFRTRQRIMFWGSYCLPFTEICWPYILALQRLSLGGPASRPKVAITGLRCPTSTRPPPAAPAGSHERARAATWAAVPFRIELFRPTNPCGLFQPLLRAHGQHEFRAALQHLRVPRNQN